MKNTAQCGFTLIEMLVTMVIALAIMAGVVRVYVSSSDSYQRLEGLAEVQNNGRFLMGFMQSLIESTDYRGCMSVGSKLINDLNSPTAYAYNFSQPIYGNEATGASAWSPALDAALTSPLSGNDSITVRGPVDFPIPITVNMGSAWDSVTVSGSNSITNGDILMVSDCKGNGDVFQVTGITAASPNSVLAHAASGTPGNATNTFYASYLTDSSVVPMATTAIYLRRNTTDSVNSVYVVQPSIRHSTTPEELVQGVDGLQIRYGIAPAGTTSAVRYVAADAVDTNSWWDQVVSVRIEALVSTANPVKVRDSKTYDLLGVTYGPYTDMRLRRKFSTTVTLRNRYLKE